MKIGIGSAQFGLNYGISNQVGKTSSNELANILSVAEAHEINILDTSPAYGDAEEVLGNQKRIGNFQCITKTLPIQSSVIKPDDVNYVRERFMKSLINLNRDQIDGLIIHSTKDIHKQGSEYIFEMLTALKEEKLVKKIGVSVYHENDINHAMKLCDVDIVQLPISIFDQSFLRSGMLHKLASSNIEIHARSVFLQGAIFLDPSDLPEHLVPLAPYLIKLYQMALENGLSVMQLALNFVQKIGLIDVCVVGINTAKHLSELIKQLSSVNSGNNIKMSNFHVDFPEITNPSLWQIK